MSTTFFDSDYKIIQQTFDPKQMRKYYTLSKALLLETEEEFNEFEKNFPEYVCPLTKHKITLLSGSIPVADEHDIDFSKVSVIPYDMVECAAVLGLIQTFQKVSIGSSIGSSYSSASAELKHISRILLDDKTNLEKATQSLNRAPDGEFDKSSLVFYKRRIAFFQNLSRFFTLLINHYAELAKSFLIYFKWCRVIYLEYYKEKAEAWDEYNTDKEKEVRDNLK